MLIVQVNSIDASTTTNQYGILEKHLNRYGTKIVTSENYELLHLFVRKFVLQLLRSLGIDSI